MSRGTGLQKTYNLNEMREVKPTPHLNLEGVREIACYEPLDGTKYRYFVCEAEDRYKGGCPHCGSVVFHSNGYAPKERLIHDVNTGMTHNDIGIRMRRYLCQDCGATFTQPIESIADSAQMTKRLVEQVRYEAFENNFLAVSKLHRCSDSTVEKIFDEYVVELEEEHALNGITAPRVLGIDEKHIQHKMHGIFVNVETGEVLELSEDNSSNTMKRVIMGMDHYEDIQIVTMDMANGYKSMIEEILPHATIVIDKFHVVQDMAVKVRIIRKRLFDTLKDAVVAGSDEAKLLAAASMDNYLFRYKDVELKANPNLANQARLMAALCDRFPEFKRLRNLKRLFEAIYLCSSYEEASAAFLKWEQLVDQSDKELFKEFYTLKNSMRYWRACVLNYFKEDCQFTNAITENRNGFTERLNVIGNGYSFKRLRAKVLFYYLATQSPQYISQKTKVERAVQSTAFTSFYSGKFDLRQSQYVTEEIEQIVPVDSKPEAIAFPSLLDMRRTMPVLFEEPELCAPDYDEDIENSENDTE
jgi:transposase